MSNAHPRAQFSCSAGTPEAFPRPIGPEYCVLGRSNVGKSSFINHVFGDRRLARVSSRPGKTTLANFYRLSTGDTWIDLPGYGYAHAAKADMGRLAALVRECCRDREQLRGALWLVDIRHPGLDADRQAREWLLELGLPVMVLLTKSDKVSHSRALQLEREHARVLGTVSGLLRFSIQVQDARQAFWTAYHSWHAATATG